MHALFRRLSFRAATLVATVAATVATAACEDDGSLRPDQETMRLGQEAERATTWQPTDQEQVSLALSMDSVIEPERPVPITVTVHNGSDRAISIGFGRREPFQVLVARREGEGAFAGVWSPGSTMAMGRGVVITDPLAPGRDTVFRIIWPAQDDAGRFVPPGLYRVRAYVAAELLRTSRIWTDWKPIEIRAAARP